MIWLGVTGSWRKSCPELEQDLKYEVNNALSGGKGIIAGGALGVDFAATALALNYAPDGSRLRVFLPTTLDIYARHYRKRAQEGVITNEQAENLITQLEIVDKLDSLTTNSNETEVNETTYYLRNNKIAKACDEILAFQVNQSSGTQNTITKARQLGKPVSVFNYRVEP